jgi:hypothetical protein
MAKKQKQMNYIAKSTMQMNLTRSQSSTPPTNPFPEKQKALHPI